MTIKSTLNNAFKASRAKPIAMGTAALLGLGIASYSFGRKSPQLRQAAATVGNLPVLKQAFAGLSGQVSSDGKFWTIGK